MAEGFDLGNLRVAQAELERAVALRADYPEALVALGDLLALSRHANVAVKVTGAVTLSRRPFPYDDLWEPLARLFDAFGLDRCLWGTDWTRTTPVVTYADAVAAFRDTGPLSAGERTTLCLLYTSDAADE